MHSLNGYAVPEAPGTDDAPMASKRTAKIRPAFEEIFLALKPIMPPIWSLAAVKLAKSSPLRQANRTL
jgi:hypothetical protein